MRIAFVGKGGSGKTTLSSLFLRYVHNQGKLVLAIDADINQHLAEALGGERIELPALGNEMHRIKEYLRGTNPRIASVDQMLKTTPPGNGSRLLKLSEPNPVLDYFVRDVNGIKLMATGPFTDEDMGVACYHSKTGAVELILNHLLDGSDEYVVVDMTAGADAFASGLFTRFDLTVIVVEPTKKSLAVYEQYRAYADPYKMPIVAIGNKVQDESDKSYLREKLGAALIGFLEYSRFVRQEEKNGPMNITGLEQSNQAVLQVLETKVASIEKNWQRSLELAQLFHKRNAESWANALLGIDATTQIDLNFQYPVD